MAGKFEHKFKLLLGVTVLVAHKNFQCCELYYYVYYFYMCLMKIITVKVYMAVFSGVLVATSRRLMFAVFMN